MVRELGFGAFSRLPEFVGEVTHRMDALVLTHVRPNHIADVHALSALKYSSRPGRSRPRLLANLKVMQSLESADPPPVVRSHRRWAAAPDSR